MFSRASVTCVTLNRPLYTTSFSKLKLAVVDKWYIILRVSTKYWRVWELAAALHCVLLKVLVVKILKTCSLKYKVTHAIWEKQWIVFWLFIKINELKEKCNNSKTKEKHNPATRLYNQSWTCAIWLFFLRESIMLHQIYKYFWIFYKLLILYQIYTYPVINLLNLI